MRFSQRLSYELKHEQVVYILVGKGSRGQHAQLLTCLQHARESWYRHVGGHRSGRAASGANLGEAAPVADLGGSRKYSNKNFED